MPQYSNYRPAKKEKSKSWWPLMGLLMAISAGAVAFVLAKPTLIFIDRNIRGFSLGGMPRAHAELFVGIVIFFIVVSIGSLIVAAMMPKQRMTVQDKQLVKDKDAMLKAQQERQKRRRSVEREMRKQNKRLS